MRLHRCLRWIVCFLFLAGSAGAMGQGTNEVVNTQPGVSVRIAYAKCIFEPVKNSGTLLTKDPDGMMRLDFTPDPLLRQNAVVYLEQGDGVQADGHCTNAVPKRVVVNLDQAAEVPKETLATASRVLVAALVIAILLESAFELLFNWRLFQAYFVGKAWRTPIMFLISLTVTRQFGIDVLGPLFDAYNGSPAGTSKGGWLTSVLTAMILAGGSVGVNRIMTRLNIRSPFPKTEEERLSLSDTEAYVSIRVIDKNGQGSYIVTMTEGTLNAALPAVLGVVGKTRSGQDPSLWFPSKWRIPRSGGIKVSVNKTYDFSVTDTQTNISYNLSGAKIGGPVGPTSIRFAPRAFVDLAVVL